MNKYFGESIQGTYETNANIPPQIGVSYDQDLNSTADVDFNNIKLQDGSEVNPSYSFTNEVTTGMYKSAESLCFVKNKLHRLLLSETDIKLKDVPTKLESSDLIIGDGLLEKFKVKAFNGSTYIAGNVGIKTDPNATTNALSVNGSIQIQNDNGRRWTIESSTPGYNYGSDLIVTTYDDNGNPYSYPLIIDCRSGYVLLGSASDILPQDPLTVMTDKLTENIVIASFSSYVNHDEYASICLGSIRGVQYRQLELAYYSNETALDESTGRLRLYQGEDAIMFNGLGRVDIPKNLHVGNDTNINGALSTGKITATNLNTISAPYTGYAPLYINSTTGEICQGEPIT